MTRLKRYIAVRGHSLRRQAKYMPPRYRGSGWASSAKRACGRRAETSTTSSSMRSDRMRSKCAESAKHKASKLLCPDSFDRSDRAAQLIAILQTPYRSAQETTVGLRRPGDRNAQQRRSSLCEKGNCNHRRGQVSLRGLNRNHNHELKNISRAQPSSPATKQSAAGIFTPLCCQGMRRKWRDWTLARKNCAIILIVWKKKKGVSFDANI